MQSCPSKCIPLLTAARSSCHSDGLAAVPAPRIAGVAFPSPAVSFSLVSLKNVCVCARKRQRESERGREGGGKELGWRRASPRGKQCIFN